jgi:microcystin-dependent protein
MADPTTGNKLLAIPTRGSDSGTWDLPVNSNSNGLDGMLGGAASLSFSGATTVLLTTPSTGTVGAVAGPNQSQNALLIFTGTLTGTATVQFTLPGFYIVHNRCLVGNFCVTLSPASGTGNVIGVPPGTKQYVFFDGTNMDYVDLPFTGSYLDLAVAATPAWMVACTVPPFLVCDGSLYTSSVYPSLNALLGSTFGGNGLTTFGVPDLRARYRIPLDNMGSQGAAGRVTSAISGINGTTIAAAGGNQSLQGHVHTTTITDPGHVHASGVGTNPFVTSGAGNTYTLQGGAGQGTGAPTTANATTNISVAVNTTGTGASGNIPPGLVSGMTFIKT